MTAICASGLRVSAWMKKRASQSGKSQPISRMVFERRKSNSFLGA